MSGQSMPQSPPICHVTHQKSLSHPLHPQLAHHCKTQFNPLCANNVKTHYSCSPQGDSGTERDRQLPFYTHFMVCCCHKIVDLRHCIVTRLPNIHFDCHHTAHFSPCYMCHMARMCQHSLFQQHNSFLTLYVSLSLFGNQLLCVLTLSTGRGLG